MIDAILRTWLGRGPYRQVFLFGPSGEPFWAARTPIAPEELALLERGVALLAEEEARRSRPFSSYDLERELFVTALDAREDLYVVVLCGAWHGPPAEVVARARAALAGDLPAIRAAIGAFVS